MVLVFIICAVFIILILAIFMIMLSTVHFKVVDFKLSNISKIVTSSQNQKYEIEISLYLFNKIKWIWFRLNDNRIRKMYKKMSLEKIDIKKLEQDFKLEDLKELKELQPKVSAFQLEVNLGTEDAILTSFLIFGISTIISIILSYTIKEYKKNKYQYKIKPLYINQNIYEVKLNCIIEVKMVHIINIIYIFIKKRRVDKNERTSNRRSYGYSYE